MQVIYKLQNSVSIISFITVNTSFSQLYLIPFKSSFSHILKSQSKNSASLSWVSFSQNSLPNIFNNIHNIIWSPISITPFNLGAYAQKQLCSTQDAVIIRIQSEWSPNSSKIHHPPHSKTSHSNYINQWEKHINNLFWMVCL